MDYSEDEPFSSSRNLLLLFVSYRLPTITGPLSQVTI